MTRSAAITNRMRIRVLIIVAFVCVGFFTTLAIAWAAAWWRPMQRIDSIIMCRVEGTTTGLIGHGARGPAWGAFVVFGEAIPPWTLLDLELPGELPAWVPQPTSQEGIDEYANVEIGAGWPMTSFVATCEGIAHHEPPPGGAWHTGLGPQWVQWTGWHGALGNPDPRTTPGPAQQRILPIGIRPFALIANTVIWTIAWWLPIATVAFFRRRTRVQRGRCPACGYDLRGELAGGCSECGWNRPEPEPAPTVA